MILQALTSFPVIYKIINFQNRNFTFLWAKLIQSSLYHSISFEYYIIFSLCFMNLPVCIRYFDWSFLSVSRIHMPRPCPIQPENKSCGVNWHCIFVTVFGKIKIKFNVGHLICTAFEEKYRLHLFLIFSFDLTGICRGANKERRVFPPPRAAETRDGEISRNKMNIVCEQIKILALNKF
jgi:hypothetical protein